MYNVWTLKGTCTFVHIFVSKSSVNCVTKKEEIIIKKNTQKKTCIVLYNKAFHNNARNLFSFF